MNRFFIIYILLLSAFTILGQDTLIYPLELAPALSGNFAELRPSHFHGGLDFKTQERVGFPVRSVAAGHIYRISLSYRSYGIAVYVRHSDDRQSVYGHLGRMTPFLDSLALKEQERKRSYEIDLQGLSIPIGAAELLGYSGNTGASGGPHLHFEWRRLNGAIALNPSIAGWHVKDRIPPTISSLRIYPQLRQNALDIKANDYEVTLSGTKPKYNVVDTIVVCGRFAIGIESLDYADGVQNNLGLYEMRVYQDDSLRFSWSLDEIPFETTGDIDAFFDYDFYYRHKRRIQWTKILPNNRLTIYHPERTDGFFEVKTRSRFRIEARDISGNTSVIEANIKAIEPCYPNNEILLLDPMRSYMVDSAGVFLSIPVKALYDEIRIPRLKRLGSKENPIFEIGYAGIPLKKAIYIGLDIPQNFEAYKSQLLITYSPDLDQQRGTYLLGEVRRGRYHIMSNKFGTFAFDIDTVAPQVGAISSIIRADEGVATFRWRVKDDKSGIGEVKALVNGVWVPLLYDPRDHSMELRLNIAKGRYELEIEVNDRIGNRTRKRDTVTL